MQLYFLNYNTYGNRIVKKENSIDDYLNYEVSREISANFNINDGVDTVVVVNSSDTANYLLVVNNDGTINSRWFVMENQYKRNGQHFVRLHRDLFVDYYDKIIDAPCFIEKATLGESDPLIFNSENMTFNQIKKSETQLKDETNCPWIVGYYDNDQALEGAIDSSFPTDISLTGSIKDWEYYKYTDANTPFNSQVNNFILEILVSDSLKPNYIYDFFAFSDSRNVDYDEAYKLYIGKLKLANINTADLAAKSLENQLNDEKKNSIKSVASTYYDCHTQIETNEFLSLKDKIISSFENGVQKFYKIKIKKDLSHQISSNNDISGSMLQELSTLISNNEYIKGTPDKNSFILTLNTSGIYTMSLEPVAGYTASYSIGTTRYHLQDAPYDMFAIPYSDELVIKNTGVEGWTNITCNKSLAFKTAMSIIRQQGTKVKDVQLLPYCPVRTAITADGEFDLQGDTKLYSTIVENSQIVGVILNASNSSFTFDIPLETPIIVKNRKIEGLTDKYRLCSPNYNGAFDFNIAKNGGLDRFNVDCTYLPYNPYIHVNPNFKELYGNDFDDSRGLICAGDFSLPQISDQWTQYKINNKNYENIFNRQIQNMEVNNAINNVRSGVNALGAAVGIGLATQNPLIGVGSAIAGGIDMGLNIAQQQESLDFTKDLFGYNLGNIQALPDNLTKTTAFTANNKIFPFLEFYTCTDTEKQALKDKIYYNGMTVMIIGKIKDYIRDDISYIKGQLIRLQVDDDNHLLESIRQEVNKGVYV